MEHNSAAEAKPPNGPDDGVALADADAEPPAEEGDGVPAAAEPPPCVEQPDSASAAKRAAVRYRKGLLRGLEIFKRSHSAWSSARSRPVSKAMAFCPRRGV
ncbi:hypothetical protein GCM10027405_33290 [Arthrobacter alkaliphilus]